MCILLMAGHMTRAQDARFEAAVACIKKYEGMHSPGNHPYVGYGHKLLPGEHYPEMTEPRADSILRADLRQKCTVFRRFGADSLLLGTLAYNVGEYTLLGIGSRPRSSLIRKLEAAQRDIYVDYVRFCRYKGKVIPSLQRRRQEEHKLLFR